MADKQNQPVSRNQKIMERKVNLAKEADSWVMRVRTSDSRIVLRIVKDADRGIRILRQGLLLRFNPDDVTELLEEYFEAIKLLNNAAQKICEKAEVPYTPPEALLPRREMDADTKIDKTMDIAYDRGNGDLRI